MGKIELFRDSELIVSIIFHQKHSFVTPCFAGHWSLAIMTTLLHLCSVALFVKARYTRLEARSNNSKRLLYFLKHTEAYSQKCYSFRT